MSNSVPRLENTSTSYIFFDTWKYSQTPTTSSKNSDISIMNNNTYQLSTCLWDAFVYGTQLETKELEEAKQIDVLRRRKANKYFTENPEGPFVAIFMYGSKCRQLIANYLMQLCTDNIKFQQNILQLLKLLVTYLLAASENQFLNAAQCLCNILDVCFRLIPSVIDFGTYLDLVTEFSRPLPVMCLPTVVRYLGRKQTEILRQYRSLEESVKGDKKRMQTFGAKFVGLVKALEERLSNTTQMHHICTLRRLLIECLPLTHAGVTNKLSIHRAELVETQIDSKAAWQQLSVWEASAESSTSASIAGSCFSDKQTQPILRSTDLGCPYNVYEAYCHLQEFLQQPQLIQERSAEYLKHIYDSFGYVFKYFQKKKITSNMTYIFDGKATAFEVSSAAAFREAIDEAFFRQEFLLKGCLAFQTLSVPHKKEGGTDAAAPTSIIESLDEKGKRLIIDLISQVWKAVQAFEGFEEAVQQRLIKEYLWITWKQLGCSDTVLMPHHVDKLETEEVLDAIQEPVWKPMLTEQQQEEVEVMNRFMKFFERCDGDLKDTISLEGCSSIIEYPNLRREAAEWYIEKKSPISKTYQTEPLSNKLIQKLQDYRVKVKEDDDPLNEIEEAEKSKYNSVFRFRLARLFFMKYIDTYNEMSNTDTVDAKVDALVRAMDTCDENAHKQMSHKGGQTGRKRKAAVKNEYLSVHTSGDIQESAVELTASQPIGDEMHSMMRKSQKLENAATASMGIEEATKNEEISKLEDEEDVLQNEGTITPLSASPNAAATDDMLDAAIEAGVGTETSVEKMVAPISDTPV